MPGQLQQPRCNTATTSTATCSSTLHEQTWNLLQSDAADVKEKDHGSLQQLFKRGSSLSLTSDGADVSETDDSGRCKSLAPEVMPPLPCPHSGSFDGDIGVTKDSSATMYLAAPEVPPAASVQWISTWAALEMTMCFLLWCFGNLVNIQSNRTIPCYINESRFFCNFTFCCRQNIYIPYF